MVPQSHQLVTLTNIPHRQLCGPREWTRQADREISLLWVLAPLRRSEANCRPVSTTVGVARIVERDDDVREGAAWCEQHLHQGLDDVLGILGSGTGCTDIKVMTIETAGSSLALRASGSSGDVKRWERKLRIQMDVSVVSERLMVFAPANAQGIGKLLNRNVRQLMRCAGVDKFEAAPSTPIGSYFCARCGLLPTTADWIGSRWASGLRDQLKTRLELILQRNFTQSDTTAVEMALREDDPAGLRNLFVNRQKDVIHPDSGNPVTLGRALLEANLRNWRGNLDFTLPGSTEWFEAYVGVWDGGPGPPRSS